MPSTGDCSPTASSTPRTKMLRSRRGSRFGWLTASRSRFPRRPLHRRCPNRRGSICRPIAAPEEKAIPQRSLAVGDLFGRPLAVLRAARGETVWLDLRGEVGAKLDLRMPEGFSGKLFSVEAHGDVLVAVRLVWKAVASRKNRPASPGRSLVGGSLRAQVGQAGAAYGSGGRGMRGAAGSVGLRPARPALFRSADERLRPSRRAGDRLLPSGPRTPDVPELPAVLVAGSGRRRLRPEDDCRRRHGTGRRGTAASGRSWTVPPSPICPAGQCRSMRSTCR